MKQIQIKNLQPLPYRSKEAINRLRVNLSFCGTQYKRIMVTSSVPGEGKSFTTVNLWRAMAEAGKHVLLIDADVRRSALRTRYQMSVGKEQPAVGLVSYLAGQASLEDVIYSTDFPGADIIPIFRNLVNPTLLLNSPNFGTMMDALAERYDYILIDTPPLDSVSDGLQIAQHCDGALLVVHCGVTPRKLVDNSIKQLETVGCPLVGTALNQVEMRKASYYYRYSRYGYYNRYYRYYHSDTAEKNK